jgi:hypothetical protein
VCHSLRLGVSKSFIAKLRVSTRVSAAAPLSPALADDSVTAAEASAKQFLVDSETWRS